jgi:hypothetical protein
MNAQQRTRRDRALWDQNINTLWGGRRPVLSPADSLAAARKLWRHATGKGWKGEWKLTSGRRVTRPIRGTFYVNPNEPDDPGIRGIIHSISHVAHYRLHPKDAPHSIRQMRLEARLTKFAIKRGWHEPKLVEPVAPPPAPAKPDVVAQRYRRMVARRDKWAAELERAKRLLAKAEKEVRAYERRHKERIGA